MIGCTTAFVITTTTTPRRAAVVTTTTIKSPSTWSLALASSPLDPDAADREYARVRRRGRGGRRYDDVDEDDGRFKEDSDYSVDDVYDRRQRRRQDAVYENDEDWIDYDRLDDLLDDDDDEEEFDRYNIDYDYDDDEEHDLLGNVLIPNPLLDNIDPDGAAERFPELASDPRFWLDMVLFVAFLNFLSFCGPQDPFPDIPWF